LHTPPLKTIISISNYSDMSSLNATLTSILLLLITIVHAQDKNVSKQACACMNQGVCLGGICICPVGTTGPQCETINTNSLCDITCKNGGVCNILSTTYSTCWCLLGFHGDYCQRQSAGSKCGQAAGQVQCFNGGTCYENSPGASIFAYCICPPGYTGRRCETEYFRCPQTGTFADPLNCAQGNYFLCNNNVRIAGTCPKGLRFNLMKMSCDYAKNVGCPNSSL